MITFDDCSRRCLCVDCDDPSCHAAGSLAATCPKWDCDTDGDCEHCDFIKAYIAEFRRAHD